MRYEFSDSWSFNQMLLVSVFVHLFAMTVILFLPKSKLPPPLIKPIFMVELIGAFAGNVESGDVKSDSQKIMPPIAVKNEGAQEKKNAQPLLIAKKAIVPPRKTQPPLKGRPKELEKVAEVQKPEIFQPTIPVKPSKLEMKPLPKPEFVQPKLLTVQPKEKSKPLPLPKPLKQEPTKSVAVEELAKLAKLTPSIKKPPIAENSIVEQTFDELDALKLKKFGLKFDQVKVVPQLNSDNPLEGFDSMKMKRALKTTSLRIGQPPSKTEPALLENLEFESLAKRSVELENQNKENDAGDILAESEQRKKLKEILKRQSLTDLSGNSGPASNQESVIVPRKYKHIDIEVVAEIGSTAFKSGILDVSTNLPRGKKDVAKFAKLDAGQSRTTVKSSTGNPNADILSRYVGVIREKVLSNWKSPLGAEHNQVSVTFYLYPGGNVGDFIFEKSSGNSQLDALALRAIQNSAPFPKFPSEFKRPNLHISIHFKYNYLQD